MDIMICVEHEQRRPENTTWKNSTMVVFEIIAGGFKK